MTPNGDSERGPGAGGRGELANAEGSAWSGARARPICNLEGVRILGLAMRDVLGSGRRFGTD